MSTFIDSRYTKLKWTLGTYTNFAHLISEEFPSSTSTSEYVERSESPEINKISGLFICSIANSQPPGLDVGLSIVVNKGHKCQMTVKHELNEHRIVV